MDNIPFNGRNAFEAWKIIKSTISKLLEIVLFSLIKLRMIERIVEAFLAYKLLMITLLYNGAVLYNEYGVGVLYR